MTRVTVRCADCGFAFEVRYPDAEKPPAAVTDSQCGRCGGAMSAKAA